MHDPDEPSTPAPAPAPEPEPAPAPEPEPEPEPPADLTPEEVEAIRQARREAPDDPDAVDEDCGVS